MQCRIALPDGALRRISHTCQPVQDEGCRYAGTHGSNRAITRQKEADAERVRLVVELRGVLAKFKQLSGFIPIRVSRMKVSNDKEY